MMSTNRYSTSVFWLRLLSFAVFALSHSSPASAQLKDTICAVFDLLVEDAGPGIATIAVAALGVGAAFGKVSWGLAVTVGVGISVMFGATVIANAVAGDSC
jgi:type IV secretory pathway VirB2 component (pilin)